MKLEQARELANKNQTKDALVAYDKLKDEYAKNADFWLEYALVAMGGSYNVVAEKCVKESVKINPNSHAAIYVWGMIKKKSGEFAESEQYLTKAYNLNPSFHYGIQLAGVYAANKKHKSCLSFLDELKRLASNDNENSKIIFAKGNALIALGKTDEAMDIYRQFLQAGGRNFRILREYVSAKKVTEQDLPLISQYEALATSAVEKEESAEDLFLALGKVYEDLGNYQKAAEFFTKGKEILHKTRGYDKGMLSSLIEQSAKIFTPELIKSKQVKPVDGITPIFIVGLPRSGTTLLEQVLSTNGMVHACGELYTMVQIAGRSSVPVQDRGFLVYPNNMLLLPQQFLEVSADAYINTLVNANPAARVFIDKMPINVNYLGLVNILVPNAKIIHLKRDLRDVALSMFCNSFQNSGMQYSNSFEDIIFFMEQYLIILNHWKKIIPNSFIEVKYSDLISNFDETTKQIFAYCGLEWSAEARDFYKKDTVVDTASRTQVRQPLYKSSVEKWRNYEPYYGKYFEEIANLAKKYDYSW